MTNFVALYIGFVIVAELLFLVLHVINFVLMSFTAINYRHVLLFLVSLCLYSAQID